MELLNKLKDLNQRFYDTTNDVKYYKIGKVLENEKCFFEIKRDEAIAILKDLEIKDPENTYEQLISQESYVEVFHITNTR